MGGGAVVEVEAPRLRARPAGERFMQFELGDDRTLNLALNFRILGLNERLRREPPPGLIETVPALRSLLVHFDPTVLAPRELRELVDRLNDDVPDTSDLTIPGRLIRLPIAFNDATCLEACRRHLDAMKPDTPKNIDASGNVDYTAAYNGLDGPEDLYGEVLATEWWNAFVGFFPGLPFLFPLDSRYELFAPKYNPTRTWTAEGAVGLGGPCVAVYPVESPGGYQLFGRTVPVYDPAGGHPAFAEDPVLLKPGDRVQFVRVTEAELDEARRGVGDGSYAYDIRNEDFSVEAFLAHNQAVAGEAEAARARRERGAARTPAL
jgi:allophanate hydrolase subunit 1